jgi:hypothetical protein
VIEIRYWAYTAVGELYAPYGGQNLAPRQHSRQTRQKPGGFSAIVKAVREYRTRYPDKAVTYFADLHCPSGRNGWAVLMGGGSLPDVQLPVGLAELIPTLRPADNIVSGRDRWCLSGPASDYLIYSETTDEPVRITLSGEAEMHRANWIDRQSGEIVATENIGSGTPAQLRSRSNVLWIERLGRN